MQGPSFKTRLTPQRWQRLQELFEQAATLEPAPRARFLQQECAEDISLREQVIALLLATSPQDAEFEQRYDQALATLATGTSDFSGTLVGRYRVQRLLGRGGMGAVYLAERADDQYQQTVAVKLVPRGLLQEGIGSRFRSERQILARLTHPNIARLLDGGHTPDGTPYFVMEYVRGLRIDRYCDEKRLSVPERLKLMQQVCGAVQYAHQNLVVHRDLKASNILVAEDGTPKLLDFGIAKLLDPGGTDPQLTRARDRMLTPEHASPEQIRGEPVGTVSDVYSLGVLLYELLIGEHPHQAAIRSRSATELERSICEQDPQAPSARVQAAAKSTSSPVFRDLARQLAGDLDLIVLKAMRREPERRYHSAAALARDIQHYLEGRPIEARPDTWTYRTRKFLTRNRLAVTTSAVVSVLVAAIVVFYTHRLATERDTAWRERQSAASIADFMVDAFRLANPNESKGNNVTVRQLLDSAAARIEHDLAHQPRVRLTLMRDMGQAYGGLGLWPEARSILERAVAQERSAFGSHQIELARTLATLGWADDSLNQFEAAARAFEEAWNIRTLLHQDHDADAVLLLNAIAGNLRMQQHFAQALEYHRRAESAARALQPADSRVLGQILLGYAMTDMMSGDYHNAERYARESMPLVRDVVYQGADLYANAIATLGDALRRMYRLEEAEHVYRSFVERQIQRLGPDHVLVARAWNNLSNVLRAKGDYSAAESALQQALRIYSLQAGSEGLDIAISHHNLGSLFSESGDLPKALQELDTALEMKRKAAGERSPQLVSTLLVKAAVLRELGRLDEAHSAFDLAQSVAAEKLDRNDRRHAQVLAERGRLELAAGQVQSADTDLHAAVASLRKQEEPARLADAMATLGEVLLRERKTAEARATLTELLDLRRKILPAEHWAIADAESRLGEALMITGQAAQGRTLLEHGLAGLRARRPAGDPYTSAAEKRLTASNTTG